MLLLPGSISHSKYANNPWIGFANDRGHCEQRCVRYAVMYDSVYVCVIIGACSNVLSLKLKRNINLHYIDNLLDNVYVVILHYFYLHACLYFG